MKFKKFLLTGLFFIIIVLYPVSSKNSHLQKNKSISSDELTIDEEIGQVILIAVDLSRINNYKKLIKKGLIGGVLLQWGDYSLEETKQLVDKMQSWSGVPLLVAADYEGGISLNPTSLGLANLPTNMMIGAANLEKDTASLFYLAGLELHRAGINTNFAPVLDVNTNMYNHAIGVRSFGSNAETVSRLGTAVINGLQASGIMAVAKHFPGHGDISLDTHSTSVSTDMSYDILEKVHLKPFVSAIEANVMGIMTAHIKYTEIDRENIATFSQKTINGLLRKKLGFKGLVISDSLDMRSVTNGNTIPYAAVKALNAGVDLVIVRSTNPYKVHKTIKKEISNSIKPSRITDASKKIFEFKKNLGLFNGKNYKIPSTDKAYQNIAGSIAKKAITLVRDNDNIIPAAKIFGGTGGKRKKVCTVFFIPPRFAGNIININKPFVEENWQVNQYNADLTPNKKDFKYAVKCIENSDLAVIGTFQWTNKPYFSQIETVNGLLEIDKPIILVSLMNPFDIRFYMRAKTVLATYGITAQAIEGIAEVILGKIKPNGKLPVVLFPLENITTAENEKK